MEQTTADANCSGSSSGCKACAAYERRKAAQRARYASDPEYRAAKNARAHARYASDPEFRAKRIAAQLARYHSRKAAGSQSA